MEKNIIINHQKWIVTGCTGYLGKNTCLYLNSKGYNVVGVYRGEKNLKLLNENGIELCKYENLEKWINPNDKFIHCAGKIGSSGEWSDFKKNNVEWTEKLFDRVTKMKVSQFIYISSIATLGYKNRKTDSFLTEDSNSILLNGELYGRSKFLAEQRLIALAKAENSNLLILRPGLIYGKKTLPYANGASNVMCFNAVLPLLYIDDFIEAIIQTSNCSEGIEIYNCVGDEQPSIDQLPSVKNKKIFTKNVIAISNKYRYIVKYFIKLILQNLVNKKRVYSMSALKALLAFNFRKSKYDCSKLKKKTGWKPEVSFLNIYNSISSEEQTL